MIVMIFIGTLLGLCSYCMENSYKEFDIEGIADYNVWNYIDSDELDFARIEDVQKMISKFLMEKNYI